MRPKSILTKNRPADVGVGAPFIIILCFSVGKRVFVGSLLQSVAVTMLSYPLSEVSLPVLQRVPFETLCKECIPARIVDIFLLRSCVPSLRLELASLPK